MDPRHDADGFRDFAAEARGCVRELYRENHGRQTLAFARAKREEYLPARRQRMSVWDAIHYLGELTDDSDPDIELSQLEHALQTAEALRRDGQARWLVLTGFIHDLGKVLCLFGEPQWAVVGDTFPLGCAFAPEIVYPDLFDANPDRQVPEYASRTGIYGEGCGLDQVCLSWGHDEYLYHVLRDHLPGPALDVIRYHSFYAWHRKGAYRWMMAPGDAEKLAVVRRFNPYDLYSKSPEPPDWPSLEPYYRDLVSEFLPETLDW